MSLLAQPAGEAIDGVRDAGGDRRALGGDDQDAHHAAQVLAGSSEVVGTSARLPLPKKLHMHRRNPPAIPEPTDPRDVPAAARAASRRSSRNSEISSRRKRECGGGTEVGVPVVGGRESVGNVADRTPPCPYQNLRQNPRAARSKCHRIEHLASHRKKAAAGIGRQPGGRKQPAHKGSRDARRQAAPAALQARGRSAAAVAAADTDVGPAREDRRQQLGQDLWRMLEVGVDHAEDLPIRARQAVANRIAGSAAPADVSLAG